MGAQRKTAFWYSRSTQSSSQSPWSGAKAQDPHLQRTGSKANQMDSMRHHGGKLTGWKRCIDPPANSPGEIGTLLNKDSEGGSLLPAVFLLLSGSGKEAVGFTARTPLTSQPGHRGSRLRNVYPSATIVLTRGSPVWTRGPEAQRRAVGLQDAAQDPGLASRRVGLQDRGASDGKETQGAGAFHLSTLLFPSRFCEPHGHIKMFKSPAICCKPQGILATCQMPTRRQMSSRLQHYRPQIWPGSSPA